MSEEFNKRLEKRLKYFVAIGDHYFNSLDDKTKMDLMEIIEND